VSRAKPKPLLLKNLLAVTVASAGSPLFRNLWYRIDGKDIDVLRDGDLSCAFYVSSILKLFSLIGDIHTTVIKTEEDMQTHGWRKIKQPRPGAVVVWAPKTFPKSGEIHKHIGIYLGNGDVVSNSSKRRVPNKHDWQYRPVETIYAHPKLK